MRARAPLYRDPSYRSFIALLVGQIAAGVSNAHAYQDERRRVEALAEIDRAKTAFFSNVSHEFRTPLTLMMGPLEDLLLKPEGQMLDDHRDVIAMVHRNGLRLLKLVNTLLDFSRIEAGRMRARFEPVDLCALTTDLASTFRSTIERAGLEFHVNGVPTGEAIYVVGARGVRRLNLDDAVRATVLLGAREILLDELIALTDVTGDTETLLQCAVSSLPVTPPASRTAARVFRVSYSTVHHSDIRPVEL